MNGMFRSDIRRPRWASRRRFVAAALGLGVGLAVAIAGTTSAEALTAYAPLPTSPSSLLAALETTTGGFTGGEAAAAAAGGTVATASVATVGGIAVAGVGAFVASAGAVGVITRATGGSTTYLCSTGTALAALYGQNCSGYGTASTIPTPNSDLASFSNVCDSKSKCVTVTGATYVTTPTGTQSYFSGSTSGISYDSTGNPTSATYSQAFLMCLGAPNASGSCPGGILSMNPVQGKYLNSSFGWTLPATTIYFAGAPLRTDPNQGYCLGGSGRTTAQDTVWQKCIANTATGAGSRSAGANPNRFFRTTVSYTDGTSATSQSATFTEQDAALPQWPTVKTPSNSNGVIAEVRVDEWLADLTGSQNVYDQVTSSAYQNLVGQYPSCGSGNCQLRIQVDHQDCLVGGSALCQGWFTSTNPVPTGHTIQCLWGPNVLSLAECNVLSNYYKPDAQAAGKGYTDPQTGAAPTGDPVTGPKADTGTSNPSASPSASASGSTGTGGGITTDPNSKDCLGSSVTSNPVTWVTGPVTCAMQAAFQPDAANLAAKQAAVATSWKATQLQTTAAAATAVFNVNAPTSDCSGFHIDLNPIFGKLPGAAAAGSHVINVANACDEPIKTIAGICNLALVVVFGVGGILAATRYIGAAVNYQGAGSTQGDD